jgi:hypothetical protein
MNHLYSRVREYEWTFIANEGSLESEPFFNKQGPYFYQTMVRDPFQQLVSEWKHDFIVTGINRTLEEYLQSDYLGRDNFVTRRLCGTNCILTDHISRDNFLRAKSMLESFDAIFILENIEEYGQAYLSKLYPSLQNLTLSSKTNQGSQKGTTYMNQAKDQFSAKELLLLQSLTWMDKVLYEYGRVLLEKKLKKLDING